MASLLTGPAATSGAWLGLIGRLNGTDLTSVEPVYEDGLPTDYLAPKVRRRQ